MLRIPRWVHSVVLVAGVTLNAAGSPTITVSGTIQVGSNPSQAVMTPNGAEVYVSNSGDNTVSVIATATNTVISTIPVGSQPNSLAVSPDGTRVYVANYSGGGVSVINTATKTVVATIATAGSPAHDIALTPDGSKLYVAMEFGGLGRILTATNSFNVISSVTCPEGLRVTPDGTRLYVSYQCSGPGGSGGHDAVGIFNVATDAFLSSVTGLPNVGQGASTGISPNGAQFWENGQDACSSPAYDHVGCPASPGVPEAVVNVIQTSGNTLVKSLGFATTEGAGSAISFLPDASQALVGGNSLKVIDTATFTTTASVPIAASGSVVFTPDGTRAYAPVPSQNTVAILSGFVLSPGTITSLSPRMVTAGGSGFTLTVNGSGFLNGSTVQWNGAGLSTSFVSAVQLKATVPANLIFGAGTPTITVVNAGGSGSNAAGLTITSLGTIFLDDFSASTLNSAWQILPGQGSYNLGSGFLRYFNQGPLSGPNVWNTTSLSLALPFNGLYWQADVKAKYNLDWLSSGNYTGPSVPNQINSSGAQRPQVIVSFDAVNASDRSALAGLNYADFDRGTDAWYGDNHLYAWYNNITSPSLLNPSDSTIQNNIADGNYWLRLVRNGGMLTMSYSYDGVNYNTAFSTPLTKPTSNFNELLLTGTTYLTAGSFTDYSYVAITSQAPPTSLTVAPSTLPFGSQLQGTSATQTITATAAGSSVIISSVIPDNPDFMVTGCAGTTVIAGAGCTMNVTFTPPVSAQSTNPETANIVINSSAPGSPSAVKASGTGVKQARISITVQPPNPQPPSSPSLNFSQFIAFDNKQCPAANTSSQWVNISNNGNGDLIYSASASSTSASQQPFSTPSDCGPLPGGSCKLYVSFNPPAGTFGTFTGQLSIMHNDPTAANPIVVALTGSQLLDSDCDGLPDDLEKSDDMRKMGANPMHKDVFLQIDYMVANDHDHKPVNKNGQPPLQNLVDAFNNAPVSNPNGESDGIRLHLDCGPDCIMDPATGALWGGLSQSHQLVHQDLFPADNDADFDAAIHAVKSKGCLNSSSINGNPLPCFPPERSGIFRYGIFGHHLNDNTADHKTTGRARQGGVDFLVTLADFVGDLALAQAGTTMHELGHTFGLQHGGQDSLSFCKPNYLSVMNYLFQTGGLVKNGADGYLDYSRFGSSPQQSLYVPDLDESALNEAGLAMVVNPPTNPPTTYGTRYFAPWQAIGTPNAQPYCMPPPNKPWTPLDTHEVPNANGPVVDWECDGPPPLSSVKAHVDGADLPGSICYSPVSPPQTTWPYLKFQSFNDWTNLNFYGGGIGAPGAPPPPPQPAPQELTSTQDQHIKKNYVVAVTPPLGEGLALGATQILTFVIANQGNVSDQYSITASASMPWVDLTGVPSLVSLAPGASQSINIPLQIPGSAAGQTGQFAIEAASQASPKVFDIGRTSISAGEADLTVSLAAPSSALAGASFTDTITVRNLGPDSAKNTTLTVSLPPGTTVLSATAPGGVCTPGGAVCGLGNLASGASVQATIVVNVASAEAATISTSVRSDLLDPNTANNTASASTAVIGRPAISASVSSQSGRLNVNLNVKNQGTGAAQNTTIKQITTRVLAGSGTVTYASPALPLVIGNIPAGSSIPVSLSFNAPATVTRFSVTISGTTSDTGGNSYNFSIGQVLMP